MKTTYLKFAAEPSFQLSRTLKRRTIKLAALAVFGITSALASSANAAVQYSIANIAPGGNASYGNHINNNGQVAGEIDPVSGTYHALYYNGTAHDLNSVLGNPPQSEAYGINDSGLTTGQTEDASNVYHTFLYSPYTNTAQDLSSAFPGGTTDNYGNAINNSGQIGGGFTKAGQTRAFLYSGGTVQDLTSAFPIGTNYSDAYSINNSGHVVGQYEISSSDHAFLYANGTATDLNPSIGSSVAYAYGVNNSDHVVGGFWAGFFEPHAFLYAAGYTQDLNNLLPSGADYSEANGINDNDQVVGEFYSTHFSNDHAFVYSNGVAQDLNNLIDPASGWVLTNAYSINNNGQITGYGTFGGHSRAFVLSLRGVAGFGTVGSGGKLSTFSFSASSTPNAPYATGSITFATKSGINIQNAPIESLTYSGNTATFSGVVSRGKGNNPGFFVVTIDSSAQTFSITLYVQGNPTPYFTQSGPLTNGVVSTSGPTLI